MDVMLTKKVTAKMREMKAVPHFHYRHINMAYYHVCQVSKFWLVHIFLYAFFNSILKLFFKPCCDWWFVVEYNSFWRCYFFLISRILLSFRWNHSQTFMCKWIMKWESTFPTQYSGVQIFKRRKCLKRNTLFYFGLACSSMKLDNLHNNL